MFGGYLGEKKGGVGKGRGEVKRLYLGEIT